MFGKVAVRIYVKSITLKLEKLTDSVFLQKVIAKQCLFYGHEFFCYQYASFRETSQK